MFQTRRLGRSTALSLATYAVAACLAIAVAVSAWHYNQRIGRLEAAITAATESRREFYVRDFATALMSDLLHSDTPLNSATLKDAMRTVELQLRNRAFNISSLHVEYHPGNQSDVPSTDGSVGLSFPADEKTLCENGQRYDDRYVQDDLFVEAIKDDDESTVCFTATKLKAVKQDGPKKVVWSVALFPEPGEFDPVVSTEERDPTYSHLPAWTHSATILLSIGVGCLVISTGRRLKRTANRLSSMWDDLNGVVTSLHDARDLLAHIRWEGLHPLEGVSAGRLADVEAQVNRVFDNLAVPLAHAKASLGAANWLLKEVAGWDGSGEFTDLAEMARRIAAEEGTAVQQRVAVEVEDVIAQRISEYDAVTLLRNLIGNAFKHGEPPITVTVTRRLTGPYQKEPAAELVVVNDGTPYLPAEDEGKGHGLKIVGDLAIKYRGSFDIVAGGNGRGAVARLTLDI